ncbi:MAG TPA: DUF3027 domain-containing protein [Nocardioidaceae bacterium]|nr:DUF3027 domain-containing protein [Nocardioidaceae bacterium]
MAPPARSKKPDTVLADAVEAARAALLEAVRADQVGEHDGYDVEGERVLTHHFHAVVPGYRGWRWSVTVTRASRQRTVTIDEIVLLPGPGSLLAPAWVPWRERIRPGDLGPGDILPSDEDDPRLVPGFLAGDDLLDADLVPELEDERTLGRTRVLSVEGREEAADRWYDGSHGPTTPIAQSASAQCATCGFLVKLAGELGKVFGVCANGYAGDDGRVVSFDHGCGAHSEVKLSKSAQPQALPEPVFDTIGYDDVETF